jgi:hypothetical protein
VLVERDSGGYIYVKEPEEEYHPVNLLYWGKTFNILGKKNFIANDTNSVQSGECNFITGNTNQITSGNGNIIGGYNNILNGTYVGILGNLQKINGDQNFGTGSNNSIGYAVDDSNNPVSALYKSNYSVVGG